MMGLRCLGGCAVSGYRQPTCPALHLQHRAKRVSSHRPSPGAVATPPAHCRFLVCSSSKKPDPSTETVAEALERLQDDAASEMSEQLETNLHQRPKHPPQPGSLWRKVKIALGVLALVCAVIAAPFLEVAGGLWLHRWTSGIDSRLFGRVDIATTTGQASDALSGVSRVSVGDTPSPTDQGWADSVGRKFMSVLTLRSTEDPSGSPHSAPDGSPILPPVVTGREGMTVVRNQEFNLVPLIVGVLLTLYGVAIALSLLVHAIRKSMGYTDEQSKGDATNMQGFPI